jgi:hypothetical protein
VLAADPAARSGSFALWPQGSSECAVGMSRAQKNFDFSLERRWMQVIARLDGGAEPEVVLLTNVHESERQRAPNSATKKAAKATGARAQMKCVVHAQRGAERYGTRRQHAQPLDRDVARALHQEAGS